MRLDHAMPRSEVQPGIVLASAKATPSNVLWESFLTITSHGRSPPVPGPEVRRWGAFVGVIVVMRPALQKVAEELAAPASSPTQMTTSGTAPLQASAPRYPGTGSTSSAPT